MGVPAIRIQTLKMAMLYTQAVHRNTVYRAMVATIQNFNLSIEGCLLERVLTHIFLHRV